MQQQSVIIQFRYDSDDLEPFYALVYELLETIENAGVGRYDGHGAAEDHSEGTLFMYGPDANRLFNAVQPVLKRAAFMKGATAYLRFGLHGEGLREVHIEL